MKATGGCASLLLLLFSGAFAQAERWPGTLAGDTKPTATTVLKADRSAERTSFQSAAPFSSAADIRSDVAIVYGVDDTLSSRVAEWKRQGYATHVMTGAAWGQYENYIEGRFDGRPHRDEGQVDGAGAVIWHHANVPYMVPTPAYTEYLKSLGRQSIDAGADALHFEEPEFWSRAGYSEGFKSLWRTEYGEEWRRPDSSPDAFWRAGKLKYHLYKRTLEEVFREAKSYAAGRGRSVRCFVPTHSLISYAQWKIVSPESSLMDLPNCDGYIAQVWTGTARSPNLYRGTVRERTFETAFLEYASVHSMVAPTGRTVYFLADPVEDDPNHTWDDYRSNYERVVVASLLFPDVHHYEVMPWPERVMTGRYPAGSYGGGQGEGGRITIPPAYASELMTVVNALGEMGSQKGAEWQCGSSDVAVLASDTMMFQKDSPWDDDTYLSGFFGLAMPLVKHGIPARCVILERTLDSHAFDGVNVLLASYEAMKPLRSEYNEALARWVRRGGVLVYFGSDRDRFHGVREWWNTGAEPGATARTDLFRRLGLSSDIPPGGHAVGSGKLLYEGRTPKDLAADGTGAGEVIRLLKKALEGSGRSLQTRNHLRLQRGQYVMGAVLDESEATAPLRVAGLFCDLFTSGLVIRRDPEFCPGEVFLLRKIPENGVPEYLGGNLRLESMEEQPAEETLKLHFRGPSAVEEGLCRLSLPRPPRSVLQEGAAKWEWSPETGTVAVRFPNRPGGTTVTLSGLH